MALRLRITGRVQGVGFRNSLCVKARELGLAGWVRNRRDGSVEAVIQGSDDKVQTLLAWARRGPPAARVDDLRAEHVDNEALQDFEQRPTA